MKKYELVKDDKIEIDGHTLYQIRACKDFIAINGYLINVGDFGGYIENENNLSHEGRSWVGGNAKVFGNAVVRDNACVCDDAIVRDRAVIKDKAVVGEQTTVCEDAIVSGDTVLTGKTMFVGDSYAGKINNEFLEKAMGCVFDRGATYGKPKENFANIARLWNAYLQNTSENITRKILGLALTITPQDVGFMMILLKIARCMSIITSDSIVDIAGYAACIAMTQAEDEKEENND